MLLPFLCRRTLGAGSCGILRRPLTSNHAGAFAPAPSTTGDNTMSMQDAWSTLLGDVCTIAEDEDCRNYWAGTGTQERAEWVESARMAWAGTVLKMVDDFKATKTEL